MGVNIVTLQKHSLRTNTKRLSIPTLTKVKIKICDATAKKLINIPTIKFN